MTDHPYTDDDLRAEAARQHAVLAEDPDFMGVGEQMQGQEVTPGGGVAWGDFNDETSGAAQRRIHDLIDGAADISDWAVALGADGLEPDPRAVTIDRNDRSHITLHMTTHRLDDVQPLVRAHFAFAPDVVDAGTRLFILTRLGQLLGQAIGESTS